MLHAIACAQALAEDADAALVSLEEALRYAQAESVEVPVEVLTEDPDLRSLSGLREFRRLIEQYL